MRSALVRAGKLFASLLVFALVLVPTASAATGGEESHRNLTIQMKVGGFKIEIDGQEEWGSQAIDMTFVRGDQFAQYLVPAEITESTIKAKFGALGELDYTYAPKGATAAAPRCLSRRWRNSSAGSVRCGSSPSPGSRGRSRRTSTPR